VGAEREVIEKQENAMLSYSAFLARFAFQNGRLLPFPFDKLRANGAIRCSSTVRAEPVEA